MWLCFMGYDLWVMIYDFLILFSVALNSIIPDPSINDQSVPLGEGGRGIETGIVNKGSSV